MFYVKVEPFQYNHKCHWHSLRTHIIHESGSECPSSLIAIQSENQPNRELDLGHLHTQNFQIPAYNLCFFRDPSVDAGI